MILQAINAGYIYGFSVMEMTGLPSGTVYPAMRKAGTRRADPVALGTAIHCRRRERPARKYYRLTGAGKSTLGGVAQALSAAGAADSVGRGETCMTRALGLQHCVLCFRVPPSGFLGGASLLVPAAAARRMEAGVDGGDVARAEDARVCQQACLAHGAGGHGVLPGSGAGRAVPEAPGVAGCAAGRRDRWIGRAGSAVPCLGAVRMLRPGAGAATGARGEKSGAANDPAGIDSDSGGRTQRPLAGDDSF